MVNASALQNGTSRRASLLARPAGHGGLSRKLSLTVYHENRGGEPLFVNSRGQRKIAGFIVSESGELVFEKMVQEAKHLHRRFNAWGIDSHVLQELWARSVAKVRIIVTDRERMEEAGLDAFDRHGFDWDFGYGLQRFLPRKHFKPATPQLDLFQEVGG